VSARGRAAGTLLLLALAPAAARADAPAGWVPRFAMPGSGLQLERRTQPGSFFAVVGRRAAAFGYENRGLEAWAYPLKLVEDFRLSFRLEGYPLDIEGSEVAVSIRVRPEATTFTYSHPAFTVEQIMFVPLGEPAVVMLLDVKTALPMTITGSFRPRLRLMWPAGLQTGDVGWDEKARLYTITEETKRFVAVVGSPSARELSLMPYQEEPRDVPVRFTVEVPVAATASHLVPIVFAGGFEGKDAAKAAYQRVLASVRELYEGAVDHYRELQARTVRLSTPDPRVDEAFAWAKVGIDKGMVDNPLLGTGLVAGFRTSGESERPGFAWLFGRDALWSTLAIDSYGDFALARAALEFLRKYQRGDGKIPHEVSQSASLVPWFTDYPYPWNAADATPLYVVAQADLWRASGDRPFLERAWDSIVRAWRFTAATDTDGNGLVENTKFGHGWVEGGALHPAHEEIYLQGVWMEASLRLAELAEAMGDPARAAEARQRAERTRAAVESTYWLAGRSFYGFATKRPPEKPPEAEPGPNRARRQARLDELKTARFIDEDTVLPAVPMWWGLLDAGRAESELDHLGGASLATDWGARLLSNESRLYDPLSYHYGSVWPLFTGWSAVAAYRYGRPHVGYQALMANVALTFQGALGSVTELLSGDFDAPFTRSSHHQVWSEAMVVLPLVRGLLGLEVRDAGRSLALAPQLPADWERVSVENVPAGGTRLDIAFERAPGRRTITVTPRGSPASGAPLRLELAPALPLDARVRSVTADGASVPFRMRPVGDGQRAEVELPLPAAGTRVAFELEEGTEVFAPAEPLARGASSRGLRVLRARAEAGALSLVLEGLAGRAYRLGLRSPRQPAAVEGVEVEKGALSVSFAGAEGAYVRRELSLPLR
jgi:glycogen debranching enzyme